MPLFSITPAQIKALIPTISGNFCERFKKLISFPTALHALVSDLAKEDGTPTDKLIAAICALPCLSSGTGGGGGGGTVNPNLPAPTNLFATDGAFSDHVHITWTAPTVPTGQPAVSQYKLYRALSTVTNPTLATLITTISAPATSYDDTTATQGVIFRYWLVALNATNTSAFSAPDLGNASVPTGVLDDIVDLRASFGFGFSSIALVWTPPSGASNYDVYRNTVNTFSSATKIYTGISPASTALVSHPTGNPTFWDNEDEVVLYDTPPSATQDYYYWVVAKGDSPPSESNESNSALGRVQVPAIYSGVQMTLDSISDTYVVDTGYTKMWAVVKGSGGGGAGGNATYGGGGGGGGGIVVEAFNVVAGDTILVVSGSPTPDTGNATSASDGADGGTITLKINGVTKVIAQPGGGGQWNAAGGGSGGAGAFPGGTGTTSPTIYNGKDGRDASGASGGKSGYEFTQRRAPQADALGVFNGDGDATHAGSGAKAIPVNGALAVGGHGGAGNVFLAFGP